MSAAPKITVLTPTYNRPAYLPQAIASVIAQVRTDWEMLVVNDGGVDVRGIVEGFGDPRVRYYNREQNSGKAACLNFGPARGARRATSPTWTTTTPGTPTTWRRWPACSTSSPPWASPTPTSTRPSSWPTPRGRRYPLEKRVDICRDFNRIFMFHFNHTLHVSLMHRRDLALRVGGYDEARARAHRLGPDAQALLPHGLRPRAEGHGRVLRPHLPLGPHLRPAAAGQGQLPPQPAPHPVPTCRPALAHGGAGGRGPARCSSGTPQTREALEYLADKIDYPVQFVLVDCTAQQRIAGATSAGLEEVEAPAGRAGRRRAPARTRHTWPAPAAWRPSSTTSPRPRSRARRTCASSAPSAHMRENGCAAVRWSTDPAGDYDVLLTARSRPATGAALAGGRPR